MDKEKILKGLVEHEGKWISIADKLNIERLKVAVQISSTAAPSAMPAHISTPPSAAVAVVKPEIAPVASPVQAAVASPAPAEPAAQAEASNELPVATIFPQTIDLNKKEEEAVDGEASLAGSYAEYVASQKSKKRLLTIGVLVIAVIAGLLISYLMLPSR